MLAALPGLKRLETEVHMIIGQMLGIGLPAESEAGKALPARKPVQIKFPRETLLRLDIEKLFSVFHKERREARARGDVVHPTASLPQEFAREIRNLKRLLFLYQYKDGTHEASECAAEVEVLEALRELYVLKRNTHAWAQGQDQYESELERREEEYEGLMPREYERYVDPEEERAMMHDEAALLTVRRGE